jgi:hypothetical protein
MTSSTPCSDTQDSCPGDYVWVTRLGEQIPLRNMTERHMLNTEVWVRQRLAELKDLHEESKLWADIDGKGSGSGFSGFEDRIQGFEIALENLRAEIANRGLTAHPEPLEVAQR